MWSSGELLVRVEPEHELTGRQEEVYDSTKDKEPPVAFQQVAKSVGVPLSPSPIRIP